MSKILYFLIFLVGLGLIWGGYLYVLPESCHTDIGTLNTSVFTVLYVLSWGKYSILLPKRSKFGTQLAGIGIIWTTQNLYFWGVLILMGIGAMSDLSFKTQLFLQIAAVFLLLIGLTSAVFAVEHATESEARDQQDVGNVLSFRDQISAIRIMSQALGPEYTEVCRKIDEVAEEQEYLCGSSNPAARAVEMQINADLAALSALIQANASPGIMMQTLGTLLTHIALRKSSYNS